MGTIYLDGICYSSGGGGGGASSADQVSLDDTNLAYEADDVQEAFEKVTKSLTYAEYEALTEEEKNNGTLYFITDVNGDGQSFQPVIYSTEEREIGVWTDGKPLYEKTVVSTSVLTQGTTNQIDLGITNVKDFVRVEGFASYGSNNSYIPLPYGDRANSNICITTITKSGTANIYIGSDYTSPSTVNLVIIAVRYTKTTDAAGSGTWTPQGVPAAHYSTDEQVVGTWIDGKTLYQKTLTFQAASTRDYTRYPLGVSVDYATVIDSAVIKNGQIGIFNGDYDGSPANDEWQGFISKTNNSFDYRVGANYLDGNCYVTIRYTKSST